jgi:hypothetical protein
VVAVAVGVEEVVGAVGEVDTGRAVVMDTSTMMKMKMSMSKNVGSNPLPRIWIFPPILFRWSSDNSFIRSKGELLLFATKVFAVS